MKLKLTSAIALLAASAAYAQDDSAGLQEIVVTAQHRSENLQNTPLAITALTADALKDGGINSVESLGEAVTGLEFNNLGSYSQLFIRGIGSSQFNALGDPDIDFNVDGIYQAHASGPNGIFYDLNRVEVLKGPQGTLYGRNATSGAINVVTNDPESKFSAATEVQTGNYGLFQAQGMLNLPVDDTLALRGAFQWVRHDGYLSDGYDDANDAAGRLKALWKPNEDIRLLVSADYAHQGGKGWDDIIIPFANASNPWQQKFSAYTLADGYTDNTNMGIQAQLDWNLDFATLTVLPAFRDVSTNFLSYAAGNRNFFDDTDRQTTLEARLASNDSSSDALKWLGGVYLLNDDAPTSQNFGKSNTSPYYTYQTSYLPDYTAKSAATFGQATYSVTSWLRATGGLRYTVDQKDDEGGNGGATVYTNTNPNLPSKQTSFTAAQGSHTWYALNWKGGLDADIGPQSMVYFNASTGYKEGGFYLSAPPYSYGPEKITSYSLGTKNRFLSNRLELNAELFDWEYRNHQVSTFIAYPTPTSSSNVTVNAGQEQIRGFDIDTTYMLTDNDRLSASVEYLSAIYQNFVLAGTKTQPGGDYTGDTAPFSPRWTTTLGYQHIWDLDDSADISAQVMSHLASGQWVDFHELPGEYQGAYTKTDLVLTYDAPQGAWYAKLWVHNVENAAVITLAASTGKPTLYGQVAPPRTYGVTLGAKF